MTHKKLVLSLLRQYSSIETFGKKRKDFCILFSFLLQEEKKIFFLNPHNCLNWKRFLICFMAACLWLVSVQSKNLAPSPAEAALQTFQLCSRAAGAAHSPEIPAQGPRWHAGAWPPLPGLSSAPLWALPAHCHVSIPVPFRQLVQPSLPEWGWPILCVWPWGLGGRVVTLWCWKQPEPLGWCVHPGQHQPA